MKPDILHCFSFHHSTRLLERVSHSMVAHLGEHCDPRGRGQKHFLFRTALVVISISATTILITLSLHHFSFLNIPATLKNLTPSSTHTKNILSLEKLSMEEASAPSSSTWSEKSFSKVPKQLKVVWRSLYQILRIFSVQC